MNSRLINLRVLRSSVLDTPFSYLLRTVVVVAVNSFLGLLSKRKEIGPSAGLKMIEKAANIQRKILKDGIIKKENLENYCSRSLAQHLKR